MKFEKSQDTEGKSGADVFIKESAGVVGEHLLREARTTIKWALAGLLLGGIVLGGLGFWKFGVTGLLIGAIVGAAVGGFVGGWVYFSA
jgi:hypothetical protein